MPRAQSWGGLAMTDMDPRLKDPRFWAAHYYLLLEDEEQASRELVEPLLGISAKAVEDYYFGELVKPEDVAQTVWLPLKSDFRVGVEYVDCEDDGHEVRYRLDHAAWSEPELLGFDSAHFALPAFRWQELIAMREAF